jgi:hypothetical protein
LEEVRGNAPTLKEMLAKKKYVDYTTYAYLRGKILMRREG